MGYQVVLSPAAEADLDEILTYIAQDNPEAAAKFGTAIIRLAFSLAEMPLRGRRFRRRSQFHRLIHGDYLIIYRIKETDRVVEPQFSGMEPDALRNFDRRNKTRYIPAPLCSRAALISRPLRPWPTMSGGCP